LSDLYPFVTTTFLAPAEEGSGSPMGFLNVQKGDAPFLKSVADKYTLADNYRQAVMGGTGPNHMMLGTGDIFAFTDGHGHVLPPPPLPPQLFGLPPGAPPISLVANPDPIPGTNNHYKNELAAATGIYVNCADATQPGVPAITSYLQAIEVAPNCAAGNYYALNNIFPGFHPDGRPANPANRPPAADGSDFVFVPPSNLRTIGDALIAANVSWRNIVDRMEAKPALFEETVILVTFDEGGGLYDAGFIQPVDFFGDGPRVPLIAISPRTRGGRIVHTYYDHVSILKFVERNWHLAPLTERSRDNLPNPVMDDDSPYVPRNMPAIGDLMDLFRHGDD
jgi:hypothetical protein